MLQGCSCGGHSAGACVEVSVWAARLRSICVGLPKQAAGAAGLPRTSGQVCQAVSVCIALAKSWRQLKGGALGMSFL